jgi:hypothetical protein
LIVISFIIFGGIITVLWPAAFLKMSLIKSDMWVGYIGFIRVHMLASQPLWKFWWNRIAASPVEYGIIAFGVTITAYCLIGKKKMSLLPVFSYLVLIMLMEARHVASVPTYVSSLAAVGIVASGIALPVVFEKRAWVPVCILSLMCIGLFVHLRFYYLPQQKLPAETIRTEITAFLKKEMPKKVLASRPLLSMLHYYFRDMKVDSYTPEMVSKNQEIADITENIARDEDYDGVIYFGNSVEEIQAIVSGKYKAERVNFSRPDWQEQWVYFRLRPKS